MIQRIQSIYLFSVFLLSGVSVFFFKLGTYQDGSNFFIMDLFNNSSFLLKGISIIFWLVAIMALISLFLYKNRNLQININRIAILSNLILLGLLAYHLLNLSGETSVSMKGIGSFLPLVSCVLLIMANRAIRKDDNLVKSVDRLR